MKILITTITAMTLLMGLSYTDDFEFKNLEHNINFDNHNNFKNLKNSDYYNYHFDYNSVNNNDQNDENIYMSNDIVVFYEFEDYANKVIDFVIARCNDGVVDQADSVYEACYYNGGINFIINK